MKLAEIFKKKKNPVISCKKCEGSYPESELMKHHMICPDCGQYLRVNSRQRIAMITDKNTFKETDANLRSKDLLSFPGYQEKLEKAMNDSGELEGVVCGTAKIGGVKTALFVMNSAFMMGSMGTVVGEKITRLFEYATKEKLPVIGFTTSGGARMQEGILSLMQMAKTSGAVKRHSDAGLLYITVLTDPTTGGVTASFAMEGDIIISEPKALVGFAGARVIEQTIGQKLPEGFQRAEFLLEHGFIDMIEPRETLKDCLSRILTMHEVKK
ncbi:MAG: acetyl-CoA carboxylase carboxyltransferase subunit beta [Ruminococcaceae bacterium]|nr:acetyl-CoA carboxylase carboxyltransferase subunit beta [Oscillospiraceae bacterium]